MPQWAAGDYGVTAAPDNFLYKGFKLFEGQMNSTGMSQLSEQRPPSNLELIVSSRLCFRNIWETPDPTLPSPIPEDLILVSGICLKREHPQWSK